MYELIFTVLIVINTGPPSSHIENISRFRDLQECEKVKTSMIANMNQMVREKRMSPGVFECRKIPQ
jgi:hypothetical protein